MIIYTEVDLNIVILLVLFLELHFKTMLVWTCGAVHYWIVTGVFWLTDLISQHSLCKSVYLEMAILCFQLKFWSPQSLMHFINPTLLNFVNIVHYFCTKSHSSMQLQSCWKWFNVKLVTWAVELWHVCRVIGIQSTNLYCACITLTMHAKKSVA